MYRTQRGGFYGIYHWWSLYRHQILKTVNGAIFVQTTPSILTAELVAITALADRVSETCSIDTPEN